MKSMVSKFYEKLEKCIPNVTKNNLVYARILRTGFSMLKAHSNGRLMNSSILIDRFIPIIEKMTR